MSYLKQHQAEMVRLLANGSAIPASSTRMAHAVHDVIEVLNTVLPGDGGKFMNALALGEVAHAAAEVRLNHATATTPGLNDAALAADVKALQVNQPCAKPAPAHTEARTIRQMANTITQRENTIKQLKAGKAKATQMAADERALLAQAQAEVKQLRAQVANLGQRLDAWRQVNDAMTRAARARTSAEATDYLHAALRTWGATPATVEPQRHGAGSLTAAAVLKEDC